MKDRNNKNGQMYEGYPGDIDRIPLDHPDEKSPSRLLVLVLFAVVLTCVGIALTLASMLQSAWLG